MITFNISELLLIALFSALIGFGFNKMMDARMIFKWYKDCLEYLANNNWTTLGFRIFIFKLNINHYFNKDIFNLIETNYIQGKCNTNKQSKLLYYICKPLGLCIICNTTWIGIIITIVLLPVPIPIKIFYAICVGIVSASIVIFLENLFKLIQKQL